MNTEVTPYELAYAEKVNTFGVALLILHVPVLCMVALFNHVDVMVPALAMLAVLAGPVVILLRDRTSAQGAIAIAVAAMGMSALAIYVSNGMIESHFEIFVLLALLTVFGRVAPLLFAATTIALHHVLFWLWLPTHIFNYNASLGIVALHAFFVILEVIPACWIARQLGRSVKAQGIVVEHLGNAAEQITSAASQVSSSSQSLAEGASRQAASIEETSASTEEIHSMAHRNKTNSQSAAKIVAEAAQRFEETNTSLTEMVEAMTGIRDSSEQISRIMKSIDQISFQTKILALNAAVEAARAGHAGSGFAVVADEVGSLAQRCAQAARDTSNLIEDCMARSRDGMVKVDHLAAEIRSITQESSRMKPMVDEINIGSQEQSKGIEQVARAIQQMEQITQSNAASAEETAAAAAELTTQADLINDLVQRLSALSVRTALTPSR